MGQVVVLLFYINSKSDGGESFSTQGIKRTPCPCNLQSHCVVYICLLLPCSSCLTRNNEKLSKL